MKNFIKQKSNLIGLLGVHVSFFTLDVFISTFLISRLFVITDQNIISVALFNVTLLSCLFFSFAIFSYVVRKVRCVNILRSGVLVNIILMVLIIIFVDELDKIYFLLGIINGLAMGMYWASMHTLAGTIIKKEQVSSYMIYSQICFAAAKIIFPLTLGFLIDYTNFSTAAWFAVGASLIVIFFTFFLREEKIIKEKLSMHKYFQKIKEKNLRKPVLHNAIIQFMYGAYANSINFCITILITIVFMNSLQLGVYSSLFSGSSIFLLALYRIIKNEKMKKIIFFTSLFLIVISSIGTFSDNSIFVLFFSGSYLILSVVVRAESDALRLNIMKILDQDDIIVESNLFAEFVYWLSRLFSYGLLIVLTIIFAAKIIYVIFLLTMTILMFISGVLIKSWYKKYNN